MLRDLQRIECELTRVANQYIRTRNPDLRPELSSCLERLLQGHWESSGNSGLRWFDGLVESTFVVRKSTRLDVRGLMVWSEIGSDTQQWLDRFSADLKPSKNGDSMDDYILRFAHRGLEDRRIPLQAGREYLDDLRNLDQRTWAYVFRKSEQ